MRVIRIISSLAALFAATHTFAADSGQASIRGILVIASDQEGATDRSLAPYEANLRRILRFNSYRAAGQGSTRLEVPGSGRCSLGQGNHLEIETLSQERDQLRAKVVWMQGGRPVMNTELVLRKGVPAILGGPPVKNGSGVYAVLVIAS